MHDLEAQLAECQRERDELKEWHTVEYKALEKERDTLREAIEYYANRPFGSFHEDAPAKMALAATKENDGE